jgi:hypothetical protein
METGGSTIYGIRIIIDIELSNYDKLIQEITSNAKKNNLEIEINWINPIGINNVTSLKIGGDYEDRKKFISELEKKYKIKDKKDLIK